MEAFGRDRSSAQRHDKQPQGIELGPVLEKRRLGPAPNAKEFAVHVGASYSTHLAGSTSLDFPYFMR